MRPRWILSKLRELQRTENDVFGVHLAAEEAIVIAIKHGNQNDPKKNIGLMASCRNLQFDLFCRVVTATNQNRKWVV